MRSVCATTTLLRESCFQAITAKVSEGKRSSASWRLVRNAHWRGEAGAVCGLRRCRRTLAQKFMEFIRAWRIFPAFLLCLTHSLPSSRAQLSIWAYSLQLAAVMAVPPLVHAIIHGESEKLDPDGPKFLALLRASAATDIWHKHDSFFLHLQGVCEMLRAILAVHSYDLFLVRGCVYSAVAHLFGEH